MISEEVLDAALRDLFERSPVPFSISTIDRNSHYIKVNLAYLRLVGRTWDEIDGQPRQTICGAWLRPCGTVTAI